MKNGGGADFGQYKAKFPVQVREKLAKRAEVTYLTLLKAVTELLSDHAEEQHYMRIADKLCRSYHQPVHAYGSES